MAQREKTVRHSIETADRRFNYDIETDALSNCSI